MCVYEMQEVPNTLRNLNKKYLQPFSLQDYLIVDFLKKPALSQQCCDIKYLSREDLEESILADVSDFLVS